MTVPHTRDRRKRKKSLGYLLFSFRGRIGRKEFWVFQLLYFLVIGSVIAVEVKITDTTPLYTLIVALVLMWPYLAMLAKRLHDRGRSGWWIASIFIPYLGTIAWLWLLGESCTKGEYAINRWGRPARDY